MPYQPVTSKVLAAYGAGEEQARGEQTRQVTRENMPAALQGDREASARIAQFDPKTAFDADAHFAALQENDYKVHQRGVDLMASTLAPVAEAAPDQFPAQLEQTKQWARQNKIPEELIAGINTQDDVRRVLASTLSYKEQLSQQALTRNYALDERKTREDELMGQANRAHLAAQSQRELANAEATRGAGWSEEAINLAVDQRLAGDNQAFSNVGRGNQANAVVSRLRNRLAEVATERGLAGANIAAIDQELKAYGTGVRATAQKAANIKMAGNEFLRVAPQVEAALKDVPATKLTDLNALLNAWNTRTGDPGIVKLGGAINAAINTYARAISPQGVPTVHDKEEGIKIISTWMAKGQILGAMSQMKQEIGAALKSPEDTRAQLHDEFLHRFGIETTPRSPDDSEIYAPENEEDYNRLPSGARYIRPGESKTRVKP